MGNKEIGARLKKIREEKGVARKDIADYLGVTYEAYMFYENGRNEIKASMLANICDYLNISADHLVGIDTKKWEEEVEEYNNRMISDEEKMAACLKGYVNDDYVYIVVEIIRLFSKLNKEGLLKAKERIEELSWVPNYQSPEYKALLEAEKQKIPRE